MRICVNADAMLILIGIKSGADDRVLMEQVHCVIPDFHAVLGGRIERLILVIGHENALLDRSRNKALPGHNNPTSAIKTHRCLIGQAAGQPGSRHRFARESEQQAITPEGKQAPRAA